MTKTEWEHKIVDLKQAQFKEVWARKREQGASYVNAAILAYKAVYERVGK